MTTVTMGMGKAKAAANGHARNGAQNGTRHGGREAGGQPGQQQSANEARLPGTDIVSKWVYVTPEIAEQYLASNDKNRNEMPTWTATIAQDMTDGEFHVTHHGVAVCRDGHLADRQHCLSAVKLSGKAQWMLVTTGLADEAREVIDRGRARSLAHALQIMGYDLYDNRAVAMARSMIIGPNTRPSGDAKLTAIGVRKFMERNSDALAAVMSLPEYRDRGINLPAGITGLLARAYAHVGREKLARFMAAMTDALPADQLRPGDRSARMLMAVLQKRSRAGGSDPRVTLYRKAQRALRSYLDGVDLTKMYEEDDDLFPLPAQPAGEAGGD